MKTFPLLALMMCSPVLTAQELVNPVDLSDHWAGYLSLVIFLLAFAGIMTEEFTQLRKSKPVLLAAGLIWIVVGIAYSAYGESEVALQAMRESLLAYAELMLFLLVTMTYVNALEERRLFVALRVWLVNRHFSYRRLYWIVGLLGFLISPLADNLITVLLLGAFVVALGQGNKQFIALTCLNLVLASNAGGVFSPFGDVTSLMVWQADKLQMLEFLPLAGPAVVAYLIPAMIIQFALPPGKPATDGEVIIRPHRGTIRILLLFLLTIVTTIVMHYGLYLPPVIGMLTGLSYLQLFGYYLKKTAHKELADRLDADDFGTPGSFDIFSSIARVEWDTLLFFYGVIMCVGGLGFIGYLAFLSDWLYGGIGATMANISIGLMSGVFDSIPMMYGVLIMDPAMSLMQWQLITLSTGIGGSLLAIGSAGGVALMGQARGYYTFFSHLKWLPVIALGYFAAVYLHLN